jgi:hypothetical protein
VYVDSPTDFVVDSRAIAKRDDGKVTCTITNPSGTKTENLITPLADGTYRISYTPFEEGKHVYYTWRSLTAQKFYSWKTVCMKRELTQIWPHSTTINIKYSFSQSKLYHTYVEELELLLVCSLF